MCSRLIATVLPGVLLATLGSARSSAAAGSCEALTALALANNTTITQAVVPPVPFASPGPPLAYPAGATASTPFCRVVAVSKPTSDSAINFEVWLPVTGWNGRFVGIGGGGTRGGIGYAGMADAVSRGYATASTDGGNLGDGRDGSFALAHPEKVADWAYRAVHVMTEAAKVVTDSFYGRRPQYSYFRGCSTGGHQGMAEAQRFPTDYDGILAGAPGNNATHLHTAHVWTWNAAHLSPAAVIPESKLPMLADAALRACDALDGVADRLLTDPRTCRFDPASLSCKGADGPNCLTGPQVDAIKKIYDGTRNPRTGELIYPGYPPGSEAAWAPLVTGIGTPPVPAFVDIIRIFAYQNPKYDWRTFDFDRDMAYVDKAIGSVVNSVDPNLTPFRSRGGKLLLYHGWSDQYVGPQDTIDQYDKIVSVMGREQGNAESRLKATQQFARLFMAPGMLHCSGGPGPNSFGNVFGSGRPQDADHDAFTALVQWVERGVAPGRIIATKYRDDDPARGVVMTRPLCAHPEVATYKGSGDTNDAANFVCRVPPTDDGLRRPPQ